MNIGKIITVAKRRGFIFPSSEIYGGLAGMYDFGPLGCLMKKKIENFWREFFVKTDNIYEVETCTIMSKPVFVASGHLKDFIDPLAQCKKCKSTFRADDLIKEKTGKFVEGLNPEELTEEIRKNDIKCPKCKGELSEVRIFNLMLGTNVGPVEGNLAYLRPETAAGIFVNFKNILNATRAKLPFGVAQVGISYRNEISPRHFLIRLREFRQMEIEFFVHPEKLNECPNFDRFADIKIKIFTREEQERKGKPIEITAEQAVKQKILPNQFMAYFLAKEFLWYQKLGIPAKALRFRQMTEAETPHYSAGNFDMEIEFDFGWKEVVGNAYRTDFDLKSHMKHSREDLSITENGKKVIPHVVEPSFGIDRTIYAILLYSFFEDKKRGWDWFRFPPRIAPITVAVYPLVSKDRLPEKAWEIYEMLKKDFDAIYDETGSIGKRYARSDEAGIPFAITADYQTLKDSTVTIRDRDSTEQKRIKIDDLTRILTQLVNEEIKLF
ncbi:MAG: glycine--tRNA ligase [Candidatus Aenigmarchaeota archaeon]|nr:glycine--tRNA ligase [Candidatus Aenigmarchaeota archaeon]